MSKLPRRPQIYCDIKIITKCDTWQHVRQSDVNIDFKIFCCICSSYLIYPCSLYLLDNSTLSQCLYQVEEAQAKAGTQVKRGSSFSSADRVKSNSEVTVKRHGSCESLPPSSVLFHYSGLLKEHQSPILSF